MARQGIDYYRYDAMDNEDESRKYVFVKNLDSNVISLMNSKVTRLVFSLIYPDKLDSLLTKLNNIIEYNNSVSAIVLYLNQKYVNRGIAEQLNEFEKQNGIKIVTNSEIYDSDFKYKQIDCYVSNFAKLLSSNIEFDYIIFDNPDSLCVQRGVIDYIVKFDVGINFGKINGYWKESILAHRTLVQWISQRLSSDLVDLNCKGVAHGMFMSADSARSIFSLIVDFMHLCQKNTDLPQYLAEEVLFQVMALIVEKEQGKSLKKSPTLTYMPWDRNLQWTTEQIKQAQEGVGIPKGRFFINSIN